MAEIHLPPTDVSRPSGVVLAERWADFTKAFAIYPETNDRVRVATDAFFEALREAHEASDESAIEVAFHRDAVLVGSAEAEFAGGTNLGWLAERIHRAALAGVRFEADAAEEALLGFTKRLLDLYTRGLSDAPFAETWPDAYPGLELVERRFEGEFGDGGVVGGGRTRSWGGLGGRGVDLSQEERLIRVLSENARIREGLDRLQAKLVSENEPQEASGQLDVLGRIVKLMPTDAAQEYESFIDLAANVLDRLIEAVSSEGSDDEAELNELLFAASRGLLARQNRAPDDPPEPPEPEERKEPKDAPAPQTSGPRGHAGDEKITDDEAALRDEYAELPPAPDAKVIMRGVESRAETIGVFLHNLVRTESPDVARRIAAALTKLLQAPGRSELRILRQYLDAYWHRADGTTTALAYERILEFLLQSRLAPLLRGEGFLDDEVVVGTFPRYFGLYLDSLDHEDPSHVEELGSVLATIGRNRLRSAGNRLLKEERLLEGNRATRLLEAKSPLLLPLARLVFADGDAAQRSDAVAYLRRLDLEAREAALLYVVGDHDELPRSYLMALAEPNEDGSYPHTLASEVSSLICRYVRDTAAAPELLPRRVYAISRLASFPSREARVLLDDLLHRRFLVIPAEPAAIRQAARDAKQRLERV